jgi:hypothetical protein
LCGIEIDYLCKDHVETKIKVDSIGTIERKTGGEPYICLNGNIVSAHSFDVRNRDDIVTYK